MHLGIITTRTTRVGNDPAILQRQYTVSAIKDTVIVGDK